MIDLTCFKAYDIRGEIGVNIDEDIAYRIGRAIALMLFPVQVKLISALMMSARLSTACCPLTVQMHCPWKKLTV